tara:strand:+ start:484 stop:1110 length:627 start_codon:yes stop_codon:yes gene_type:complete
MKTPRVASDILKDAALQQMAENGMELSKIATGSRAMIYAMPDHNTVRIRTTNDPVLVVVAESAGSNSKMNIEGTDFLLISMPEEPRSPGNILCYLVPTKIAVESIRDSFNKWLETNPNTNGDNKTRNIWFDSKGTPWSGYHNKWEDYLLPTSLNVEKAQKQMEATSNGDSILQELKTVAEVVEFTTHEIARLSGISREKIRIDIKFEG